MKCDNKSPCENCIKREHPQLCSYKPNRATHSVTIKNGSVAPESSHGLKRQHSPDEENSRSQSVEGRPETNIRAYGMYTRSPRVRPVSHSDKPEPDTADTTRYLGQNSIPALLRQQSSPNEPLEGVEHIRKDMRSILGLDNTAPFPLMSSRHLDKMTVDISSELPSDREVMKYVYVGQPTL